MSQALLYQSLDHLILRCTHNLGVRFVEKHQEGVQALLKSSWVIVIKIILPEVAVVSEAIIRGVRGTTKIRGDLVVGSRSDLPILAHNPLLERRRVVSLGCHFSRGWLLLKLGASPADWLVVYIAHF